MMTWQSLFRDLSASALTVLITLPAGAQSIIGKDKTGPVPNPVNLDTAASRDLNVRPTIA